MISTLPFVVVVMLFKFFLEYFFGFYGVLEFSEVALILTGGIFIMGFMLAGTLSDYKESEKIPGEISSILETMEDTITTVCKGKNLNEKEMKQTLLETVEKILAWIYKKITLEEMFATLSKNVISATKMEEITSSGFASRYLNEISALRKLLNRMNVISVTSFLQTGYALLEILILAILGILFLSKFKNPIAEYTVIAFISLIYFYLYRLIKDIDDPFEYESETSKGASEVELFPIYEYIERLKKRL